MYSIHGLYYQVFMKIDRDGKMDELIPKDLKVEVTPKPGTAPPMSLISPFVTEFESRNILWQRTQ